MLPEGGLLGGIVSVSIQTDELRVGQLFWLLNQVEPRFKSHLRVYELPDEAPVGGLKVTFKVVSCPAVREGTVNSGP